MIQDYNDDRLLFLLKSENNEEAFTELYQRYWKPLYLSARKRMRSEDDPKDMIQDLFINLWKRRSTIPAEISVAAYLHAALRYRIINYIQADQVRLQYANAQLIRTENFNSVASMAESSLALEELEAVIGEAVEAMPERMQEIFNLSYRNGLSPKEIADQLSLSVQTVKNYLSHARTLLKGRLAHQEPEVYAQVLLVCAGISIC